MIDLGLPSGTKWACCNVGATTPEGYGGFYAWGETETKNYYSWSNYIHCNGSEETVHDIGSDIAGTTYDVATVKWGDQWRLPTRTQLQELREYSTAEFTTLNGVDGMMVTGTNGNAIFLPSAGEMIDDYLYGGRGEFWTSTIYTTPTDAWTMRTNEKFNETGSWSLDSRCRGLSVRPVTTTEVPNLTEKKAELETQLQESWAMLYTLDDILTQKPDGEQKQQAWEELSNVAYNINNTSSLIEQATTMDELDVAAQYLQDIRAWIASLAEGINNIPDTEPMVFTVDGITYMVISEEDKTAQVGKGIGGTRAVDPATEGEINILAEVEGYKVVAIANYAFEGCSSLTKVNIPEGIQSIGEQGFYNCSSLKAIHIPASLTSIGYVAFSDCGDVETITVADGNPNFSAPNGCNTLIQNGNYLIRGCRNSVIPEGVMSMANCSFNGVTGMTSITLPQSLRYVGGWAFSGCSDLQHVNIPCKVYGINYMAFYNCSGLTGITLPASVEFIDRYAFAGDFNLMTITILKAQPFDINDNVFQCWGNYDSDYLYNNATLHVPYGKKTLYQAAGGWSNFQNIEEEPLGTNIEFADATVKAICVENWDTDGDGELSYSEAAVVTDLGQVFAYHSEIVSFDELQYFTGLTSIGYDAFYNCSLRSVTIPKSVTSIGDWAFEYCYNLTSITIPESVTSIGYNAFYGCSNLESIVVNAENPVYDSRDNCNAIIESASNTLLYGCQNTIIPNSVTSIGDYAFYSCSGLASITIPSSITSIGQSAFEYCNNLTSITIPSSVTSIGYRANAGCSGLTSIIVDADNPVYDSRDNCNAIIETASNRLLHGCQNTIIPNSVVSIWDYAFSDCYNLSSITIPSSVTYIGYYAFGNCSSLTSITIPSSITSVSNSAFRDCYNLTSFIVDADNPIYDSRDNCNAIVETASNTLLYGCQNTIIPNTVVNIGDYAFYDCYNLTSITIPSSVTSIGYYSFGYCNNLTSVTIPSGVGNIGNRAFYGCHNLTSITIPSSVTSIGNYAFGYCSRLALVTSQVEDPFEISDYVFYGTSRDQNLLLCVPVGCKAKYEATNGWKLFANIVEMDENGQMTDAQIMLERKYLVNTANNYCYQELWMKLNNGVSIGIRYHDNQYWNNTYSNSHRGVFVVVKKENGSEEEWYVAPRIANEWVTEKIAIGSSGIVHYYMNGKDMGAHLFSQLSLEGAQTMTIEASPYGWWTGHLHYMDDFKLTTPAVTYSDNFNDGVLNTQLWKKPVNADGLREENGILKMEQLRTDEDFSLKTKLIPLSGHDGDVFTSLTVEGVEVTYKVISVADMTCQVGVGKQPMVGSGRPVIPAIDTQTEGSVTIPKTVNHYRVIAVGDDAFSGCSSLTTINLPESIIEIGEAAMEGCYALHDFTIPRGVTVIGDRAFSWCTSLESITIPSGVTSIGEGAFQTCRSLRSIYSKLSEPYEISEYEFKCYNEETEEFNNSPIYTEATLYVPTGSKDKYETTPAWNLFANIVEVDYQPEIPIGDIEFADANVKAICVANWDTDGDGELSYAEAASVTELGTVFTYNSSIRSFDELQYFTGLTTFGENAFYNSGIASVTIPSSVTSIGGEAFSWCYNLSSITIPSGVTSIGSRAFEGCSRLETIIVDSENPVYDSRDNCNAIIETASNTLVWGCQNTIIPNSVTSIGDYAFYNCYNLTSITIPSSVTSIGDYAFYNCYNLTSITIPSSVTSIGYYAFRGCNNLTSIFVNADNPVYDSRDNCNAIIETASNTLLWGCQNTIIPNSVVSIWDYAFYDCYNLSSITIPSSVKGIGYYAFANCNSLTSITIPSSITSISYAAFRDCNNLTSIIVDAGNPVYDSRDNCNAIIETASNTLLCGCQNTIIPNSVVSIGDYAFYDCYNLTSITIPSSVTSIGYYAFGYCYNLTSVTIPSRVTRIGDYAFYDCYNLTSITIPASVTSIGYGAFMYTGLNEIISLIKNPFEINNVFEGVQTSTLYVPYYCKEKYESTAGWNSFQNIVELESLMPQPGDDMSEYLVNPRFEDGESGWTIVAAAGSGVNGREGNVHPGGSSSNLCYEAWNNSSFDIYQIVGRAPIGVYEIEVQGFYRYLRDGNAWNAYQLQESPYVKKGGVPVYVYMNNNATPFGNIFDEPVEYGSLYTNTASDDTYTDPNGEYWYPNQMNSSAEAFSAGMYKQSAFGLVARRGDVLRLGVKGASNQGGDSWVIWDNFKLTYRGFDPDVIRPVLEMAMAEANDYLGLLMGKTEYADLTEALAVAEQSLAENDGETMLQALNALYDAKDPARISKDIFFEQEVSADTLRLAEAILSIKDQKLSQVTFDEAEALLKGIAGNSIYESEEISQLKADVTYIIERLQYSADVYAMLYDAAMNAYEVCDNVGEDTRQGLSNEIEETSSLIDYGFYNYEMGSFIDYEAEDFAYYLWDKADELSNQIYNYIDPTEWQILKTAYEQSNQAGAWSQTWDFSTEKPWKSNVPGVETDDGHVVELWLAGHNLTATVPKVLFDLPRLQTIDLSNNHLTSLEAAIPAQVTDLSLGNQSMGLIGDFNLKDALSEGVAELLPNILRYDHSNQTFDAPLNLQFSNGTYDWWMDVYVDNSGNMNIEYISSPYCDENGAILNVESSNDDSKFNISFNFDEGDANFDGQVDVLDLQTSINYIFMRNGSNLFNLTAADLWKDQKINVQDVVKLVDLLMAAEDDDEPVAGARLISPPTAEASVYVANGFLVINSNKPVAAFDLVINTESGFKLSEQLRQMGITCRIDLRSTGVHLIGYSLSGKTLPAGETILGMTGSNDANVLRALLADEEAKAISVATGSGYTTGIEPQFDRDLHGDAYDLQGRKIAPERQTIRGKRSSVIIKNGQKIVK